jgi:glycosyltransferase involved in cell wall biosynthesis
MTPGTTARELTPAREATAERRSLRVFAYHENAESVAALFAAVARQIDLRAFRVASPMEALHARWNGQGGFHWAGVAESSHQQMVTVPGVRRLPWLSRIALARSYRSAVRRHGRPDFVLIDSPFLWPWAQTVEDPLVYVATDAYRYYEWPRERTVAYERAILARARASFSVSELLAEEFRAAGARAVTRLPNGVSNDFAERAHVATPTPLDLASVPGPRVLVSGMINLTYDWRLIEALAEARRSVSFVFVGPIREEDQAGRARIEAVLARPNVHWLGGKPHEELPSYLNASEVLLNPLAQNDHNDRRYPLRLCEYLATRRPVLTTAIHEAHWFAPHVEVFHTIEQALESLDRALNAEIEIDVAGREQWLRRNSWDTRATELVDALLAVAPS